MDQIIPSEIYSRKNMRFMPYTYYWASHTLSRKLVIRRRAEFNILTGPLYLVTFISVSV